MASVTSVQKTLSDLLIDYIEQFGVEYLFGIPGGHITPLYEALARSEKRGGPRAILTRHESGAAFMAAGYARETGKIGVCCATTGPGATNIITGVAAANADHVPLLVITGQALQVHSARGALQESSPYEAFPDNIDTLGMLEHCTRYNTLINYPEQFERKLAAALTTALQPLRGPAHISIPPDILRAAAPDTVAYPNLSQLLTSPSSYVDLSALEELWKEVSSVLQQGRQIALLIGHECGDAVKEIMTFAELTGASLITTQRGKPWVNPYHPLARGVFAAFGHPTARQALTHKSVEMVMAVGTSLGQWSTGLWDPALLNKKMVHIHPSNIYFTRSPMARLHVCGTIRTIFQELSMRIRGMQDTEPKHSFGILPDEYPPCQIELQKPESYKSDAVPIKPQRMFYELIRRFPSESRFFIDNGNCMAWAFHYLFLSHSENHRLLIGQPSMGCAVGGAVGTAFGIRGTPVICVVGDGSFLMYGQEITVAVAEQLPVIFVILNDQSYGMVKHRQQQTGTEPLELPIPRVDFSLMAKSVGANGYAIRDVEDFEQLDYEAICNHPGPTVLDVYIDAEEPPPIKIF